MEEAGKEKISARAYQLWLDEGQPAGQADAHWLRAEQELGGDRAAVAAETDYVMQTDEASRTASDLEQPIDAPLQDPDTGSQAAAIDADQAEQPDGGGMVKEQDKDDAAERGAQRLSSQAPFSQNPRR